MKRAILIAAGAMLNACIGTDIGGTLYDMGLSEPKTLPCGEMPEGEHGYPYEVELYQFNGQYYVEAPIVYVPQKGIWVECYSPLNCLNAMCTYRTPATYTEMKTLPIQHHYFLLDELKKTDFKLTRQAQYSKGASEQVWVVPHGIKHNAITLADPFDKSRAKHLGKLTLHAFEAHELAMRLPVQRTWYNKVLRPFAYVGKVIDTASVLTLGTLTLPIIAVFEQPECLRPNFDYTGKHRSD